MTICVTSDDVTFEQIKKQLNSMVEVIKVIDLTGRAIHMNEILYAKVFGLDDAGKAEVFRIASVFDHASGNVNPVDIGPDGVLLESTLSPRRNDELVALLKKEFHRVEVTRGGAVAVESISTSTK